MKKVIAILLTVGLAMIAACGGDSTEAGGEAEKAAPAADFSKQIGELDTKLKAAATKDDFKAVKDECLKLMMTAAMKAVDLGKDKAYSDTCQVGHAMAMADAAIKGSKPDAESPLCMGASMALALDDASVTDAVKAKVKELDKACGYSPDAK